MATDPRAIIDRSPMSRFQWSVVAIMVGLNALDGFAVLSISFASPGIARAWGIDRAALGLVLSMELLGMAVGSLLLGRIADRAGRRTTILACLGVMAAGMLGASSSHDVVTLSGWRLFTGLGIGGMLAATNAAVAEVSNAARRPLCVVLMAAGYPVGTIVGGSISAVLLRSFDWPAVFQFGAIATLCFVPLVLHAAAEPRAAPVSALFSQALLPLTLLLTLAYLAHVMTFYFILKWIPKIVVDMGFAPSAAAGVLVWASAGGLAGSVLLGLLTARVSVRSLTIAVMLISVGAVVVFGHGLSQLGALSFYAALAGFFTNAGMVGLYALVAQSFPTSLRATATGFVIGIGRGGSALAPALAGLLFSIGFGLQMVAIIMALGSLVAAVALLALRLEARHDGAYAASGSGEAA